MLGDCGSTFEVKPSVGTWFLAKPKLVLDVETFGRSPQDACWGDYGWIRRRNDEWARHTRREISALTLRAIDTAGYTFRGSHQVMLQHIAQTVLGTRIVSPTTGDWPDGGWLRHRSRTQASRERAAPTSVTAMDLTVLETATYRVRQGVKHVVAVSAASAYHAGGGFETGGRHALEEAFCVQSTLYPSLRQMVLRAREIGVAPPPWVSDAGLRECHIPDDGAILSPLVEVFRRGSNEGYPFEDEAVTLEAVVSVAMPNCNPRVSDSPLDSRPDPEHYAKQLQQKWRAVLTATACYTQARCIVIPDAGCGVFQNPPAKVGAALGHVLGAEFAGCFDEVILSFPRGPSINECEFVVACRQALSGQQQLDVVPHEKARPQAASAPEVGWFPSLCSYLTIDSTGD